MQCKRILLPLELTETAFTDVVGPFDVRMVEEKQMGSFIYHSILELLLTTKTPQDDQRGSGSGTAGNVRNG